MIAVVAGVLTAIAWALATLSATRAARTIGPWSTSGWVLSIGLVASLPLLAIDSVPATVDPAAVGWLALAGLGYVTGMVLNYSALAGGKVPVAAPIVATEGAIAAAIAVISGDAVSAPLVILLALLAAGIFLTALEPSRSDAEEVPIDAGDASAALGRPTSSAIPYAALAVAAALAFGSSLFAAGRASDGVPLAWVAAAGRVVGVVLITLPLVASRRLHVTRSAMPFVIFSGIVEVVGYYTFAWGARDSIAVTAVLASQSAVLAALVAHGLGERISQRQWVGVAVVGLGVTAITLTRL
jgi:drug/metabolite transporter (DMT)-like permease